MGMGPRTWPSPTVRSSRCSSAMAMGHSRNRGPSPPEALPVGDFNGDGVADLAVANGFGVTILLGNGDGTFQPPREFRVGFNAMFVAIADFDRDGALDLAVVNLFS